MAEPTLVPAGLVVPAELLPALVEALRTAAQYGARTPELARLESRARAAALAVSGGRKRADQPISGVVGREGGNRPTMTATRAGAVLGLTPRRVRQLARTGELPGWCGPEGWAFRPEDLEQFRMTRGA